MGSHQPVGVRHTFHALFHKHWWSTLYAGGKIPRITCSCKFTENVISKLIEILITLGVIEVTSIPLAENAVHTSRFDWSALKHGLVTLFQEQTLRHQCFAIHAANNVPFRSPCNHHSYRYPQHQKFFHCGFLIATSVVPLGWRSGRIQEWLLTVKTIGDPKRSLVSIGNTNIRHPIVSSHCGQDSPTDIYILTEVLRRTST